MVEEDQKSLVNFDSEPREIELPTLDIRPFLNIKTKIEKVEYQEGKEYRGKPSYFAKFTTQVIGKSGDIEIRASKIIGLQMDENGQVGWGKGTQMDIFLKKFKVKSPKEMIGKEVLTSAIVNKNSGKEFVSFI